MTPKKEKKKKKKERDSRNLKTETDLVSDEGEREKADKSSL